MEMQMKPTMASGLKNTTDYIRENKQLSSERLTKKEKDEKNKEIERTVVAKLKATDNK